MVGSLIMRGKTWYLVTNIGKDEKTGKYIQKWVKFGEKKPTEKEVTMRVAELLQGGYQKPTKIVMDQFLDNWLKSLEYRISSFTKKRIGVRTIEEYEKIVRVHIKPEIGRIQVQNLTSKHIRELVEKKAYEVSDFAARKIHVILNSAFKQAIMDDDLDLKVNPCTKVIPPKQPKVKHPVWNADQAMRFLEEAKYVREYGAFLISLHQGLRIGEVLGLAWKNINLSEGTAFIRQKVTRVRGKYIIEDTVKTEATDRQIVLTPTVVRELKKIQERQEYEKKEAGDSFNDLGLVFTNFSGGIVRFDYLRDQVFNRIISNQNKKVMEDGRIINKTKSLIPKIRIHDMRHSAGTLLYKIFGDIKLVQLYLGHSTISITSDTYVHEDLDMLREAAKGMDRELTKKAR